MKVFDRHVFVCVNERPAGHPRGCCGSRGGGEVRDLFKKKLRERGLKGRGLVRANKAGCLDLCELGVAVVVYPEGVWYKGVRPEDVEEIVESHLVGGRPVERLLVGEDDLEWLDRCRKEGRIVEPRPVDAEGSGG